MDNRTNNYNNKNFSKPKTKLVPKGERPKTETQNFIAYGDEKLETLFPVPVKTHVPVFQRAVGMAEGTILEANEKGNGIIEIEGVKYPMKENRTVTIQKRYPLHKYVGKTVKFSFYPTITMKGIKILKLQPQDPPFIKISNFRRELPKQGAVEAVGTIKEVHPDYFMLAIWSPSSKKEYIINIFGVSEAKVGEFVKADAVLKNGLITLETMRILKVR